MRIGLLQSTGSARPSPPRGPLEAARPCRSFQRGTRGIRPSSTTLRLREDKGLLFQPALMEKSGDVNLSARTAGVFSQGAPPRQRRTREHKSMICGTTTRPFFVQIGAYRIALVNIFSHFGIAVAVLL